MAIDKVWVLAEAGDAGPTPITLELLTEARAVAGTVEAVAWGTETASLAGPLGEYGATTVYDVGDLGGALPGVRPGRPSRFPRPRPRPCRRGRGPPSAVPA